MKVLSLARAIPPACIGLAAVLASCGGVGKGVLPVTATITPFGGVAGATSTKAFTCINTGLNLIIGFSNGSAGDFTSRATYSSSNPAVVRVSNLDIPVPETTNNFYVRGVLVPVAVGTATITVQYLTFVRTIEVVVRPTSNLTISPASADLAANSLFDLAVFADLDGVKTPLDAAVAWSIITPNTAVATIDSIAGTIRGVSAGSGLIARARIPGCDLTADAPVTVANLQSLALSREFDPSDSLIVGTTEKLVATGTLDNGKTQDISTQVAYTSADPAKLSFFSGNLLNLALAVTASTAPVQVSASFPITTPTVTAPAISINTVVDSLNTIAVSPSTTDVFAGQSTPFKAVGTYASGATQDISRSVTWSSSDATLAVVQTSSSLGFNSNAGSAAAASSAAGKSVTVTATGTSAASQTITATGTLNIK